MQLARFLVWADLVLIAAACTENMRANAQGETDTTDAPPREATVCALAQWDRQMTGTQVRVRADYFTDFRHGAFLADPKCPGIHFELGVRSEYADASLARFDKALGQHYDFYVGRQFKIDVTGVFEWEAEEILFKDLPTDRQRRIPAHGTLSLLKVWDFEKASKRDSTERR